MSQDTEPLDPEKAKDEDEMIDDAKPESSKKDGGDDEEEDLDDKIAKDLKDRTESSKKEKKHFYNEWKRNIELRSGHVAGMFTGVIAPVGSAPSTGVVSIQDELQTELNPDWSLTKIKVANLFSQVPTVQATHENDQFAPAIPPFMKAINFEIGEKRARAAIAMEEILNDVVNASGVGGMYIAFQGLFEEQDVPAVENIMLPDNLMKIGMRLGIVPVKKADVLVDHKFSMTRISPRYLLWDTAFNGSDFNDSDWAGYTGAVTPPQAKQEFKLSDEEVKKYESGAQDEQQRTDEDLRVQPNDRGALIGAKKVYFDRVFYWRHRFDDKCKCFDEIWEIIFVKGKEKPVIHRRWKGQKTLDNGKIIGSTIFPVQILTLTYITDNPIPPSDSSAGRPQVNDLRRSRGQMFQNRERSLPVRWFDVNRVDYEIQNALMNGTLQGMIPMNGPGDKAIGEVARASYPAEDFTFDKIAKEDLMESWLLTPNQLGQVSSGRRPSAEANAVQQSFSTTMGKEKARVVAFFLRCVDVLAGLVSMYSDYPTLTDKEKQQMQSVWPERQVPHDLVFKIRPDSQIILDVSQRIDKLFKFINLFGKSGFVNFKPIVTEAAELSGINPNEVVVDPTPKPPPPPQLSFRFSGKEDIINTAVMALLVENKKAPSPEAIQKAAELLKLAQEISLAPKQPGPGPAGPGSPGAGRAKPPARPAPGGPQGPAPDQLEGMKAMDKIVKRGRDINPNA